ncbi:unnamed protein product [Effrenium voratum]|nr:unnamed protein product [Effrenium voratum]
MELPVGLSHLTFGDAFNQSLEGVMLPRLQSLTFGSSFNQPLQGVRFPETLQSLTFGLSYDQAMEGVTLPPSLQSLTFGFRFNRSIQNFRVPMHLKSLTFGWSFDPESLQRLHLGGGYRQRTEILTLPAGLKSLTLDRPFDQQLGDLLRSKLTSLVREASRADLVGEYVGATAMKVQKVVKEALGGVLFIDEAYALVQGGRDNFGVEAVDTLIKEMEDNRAHLIVILAGYTKEMEDFFNSNPGFQSRVPFSFHFVDYNCPELVKIGELQLKSKTMSLKASESCTEGSACWWLRRTAQLTLGPLEKTSEAPEKPENLHKTLAEKKTEVPGKKLALNGLEKVSSPLSAT